MSNKIKSSDIAIISMACRFPDANNIDEFWNNLVNGVSSIKEIPNDRWELDNFYSSEGKSGKSNSKYGSFLKDIKSFDPEFFRINENDARIMDPQQRILIELAYETIVSSNYTLDDIKGKKVGVFLGITKSDYREHVQAGLLNGEIHQSTVVIGVLRNLIPARISNLFDFEGPSLTIDTACSSSLVALQSAKESILNGTSEMALVGGINLNITPVPYLGMSMAGALTSSSKYYVFDENSKGFIMGEGGGLVLLKKLDQAIKDNDTILGVIKGSSVNNDGKSISPMAPRPTTQQKVIKEAYENAQISSSEVSYVEAHGTGTALGDAIEAQSIIKNFAKNTVIGSVKPNIGHLLSGAGIAGLIKSLLIIKNRVIPPLVNYESPRKELKLSELGFILNKEPIKIEDEKTITIGVNAFGFGGTNAHVVLQEYKENNNKASEFKQIIPNYNKKEFWVPLDNYLEKYSNINKYFESNKVSTNLYLPTFEKEDILNQKEDLNDVYIISSYEKQNLVHKLNKYLRSKGINSKLNFDFKDINSEKMINLVFIDPYYKYLLEKLKELSKSSIVNNVGKIFVITEKSLIIDDEKEINDLSKFITSGLIFSSISEFPSIKITQIDFDDNVSNFDKSEKIFLELQNEKYETKVSYKIKKETNNNSYIQRKIYTLKQIKDLENTNNKIIENGVYLITGVTGILSEIIKKVSTYKVKIIACSRRNKEEIKEWQDIENYVKSQNSTIELIQTDISKDDDVKNLFKIIKDKYKKLNGVIHGAGVVSPSIFENKSVEEFEKVLAPKVKGIQLISNEIENNNFDIDFVTSFSSLSAVVAGSSRGISDYATANLFLDQYSKLKKNNGKNFNVINWGPWQEKGMASNPILLKKLEESGINAITLEEGCNIFTDILDSNLNQVLVVKAKKENLVYTPKKIDVTKKVTSKNLESKDSYKKVENISANSKEEKTLFNRDSLNKFLLDMVTNELNVSSDNSKVTIDSNLLDLGIDSLSAIEMAKRLQEEGFKNIPFELFFEYQTINSISGFLLKDQIILEEKEVIEKVVETDKEFSLSPLQKAFYTAWSVSDALSFSFQRQTIKGKLDINLLEKSLHLLLEKHSQLRANFFTNKENNQLQLVQKISDYEKYKDTNLIEFINLQDEVSSLREPLEAISVNPEKATNNIPSLRGREDEAISTIENNLVNSKFDLEKDILFKILVVEEKNQTHLFVLMHHIIFDGVSMKILSEELWNNYYSLLNENSIEKQTLKASYFDYINYLNTRKNDEDYNWWQNYLSTKNINIGSLKDRFNSFNDDVISSSYSKTIDKKLSDEILNYSQSNQIPLQVIYLNAYFKTLSNWLNTNELIVNLAVSGREIPIPEINKVIGCFADTYPVCFKNNTTFEELRSQLQEIKRHQNIGSAELTKIFKSQNKEYSPFAFSFAIFDKTWAEKLKGIEFTKTLMRGFNINTKFALTFWEDFEGINYTINYPKSLLQETELNNFSENFVKNLSAIIENKKSSNIDSTNVIANNGKIDTSKKVKNTLINQIIENAKNNQNKPAIIFEDEVITYEVLNKKSSLISGALLQRGFNSNSNIAIIGESSIEFIITLLGVLKIGATWIPIESSYPNERINKMLEISKTDIAISTKDISISKDILVFDDLINENVSADFVININNEKTAYIIFTSGSTGEPKGVPISYKAMENYLAWCNSTFDYQSSDRFIQTASICFDASVRQILAPLLCGGTIYPVSKDIKSDAKELFRFIQKNDISIWSSVPSLWSVVLQAIENSSYQELPKLRIIKVGGEVLNPSLVYRTQNILKGSKIVNLYGPTETTINATYHVIDKPLDENTKVIPIGKPSSNLICSVHNELGEVVTYGDIGELWVSGVGLTSGYLNSSDLNSSKFVIDEFGTRYYKTGDLVNQNTNGEYIFHGRVDKQFKIRGFRVELGEIENAILENKKVSNVFVKAENNSLIAFVESENLSINELKEYLENRLPEYLVPSKINILKSFPLMSNGKIDTNNLKEVEEKIVDRELTDTEKTISKVWSNLLNISNINSNSNFFNLGGDSILIMQMFMELENYFNKLPKISTFYKKPRLDYLARSIDELSNSNEKLNTLQKSYPKQFGLSPAQTGFFLVNKFTKEKDSSWKGVFLIEGNLDEKIFREAINIIVSRHQLLKVKLVKSDTPYFQEVDDFSNFPISFSYENSNNIQEITSNLLEEMEHQEINLEEYPLIKLKVVKLQDSDKSLLAIHSHHILSDAFSFLIMIKDVFYIYNELSKPNFSLIDSLKPLKNQFSDYISLVNNESDEEKNNSLEYWKKVFNTPYNSPKFDDKNTLILKHQSYLDETLLNKMKEISSNYNTSIFNILLSVFYRALNKFLDKNDIVVGIAHHGRDYQLADINKIFGCFARAIPIRINCIDDFQNQVSTISKIVQDSTSVSINPIELLKQIPSGTGFNALLGSQFFLTYIDVSEGKNTSNNLKINWEESNSDFEPSNLSSNIFLTAKKKENSILLSFNFKELSQEQKDTFINIFNSELDIFNNIPSLRGREDEVISINPEETTNNIPSLRGREDEVISINPEETTNNIPSLRGREDESISVNSEKTTNNIPSLRGREDEAISVNPEKTTNNIQSLRGREDESISVNPEKATNNIPSLRGREDEVISVNSEKTTNNIPSLRGHEDEAISVNPEKATNNILSLRGHEDEAISVNPKETTNNIPSLRGREDEVISVNAHSKTEVKFITEKLNENNFGKLDSALIGYLPSKSMLKSLSISEDFFKQMLFKNEKSLWLEGIKTNHGNTGFISIPFFAEEINISNSQSIIDHVFSAINHAKNLGAKYISLAGMLPAITEYGKVFSDIKEPIITTGHSTTVSAVVKNTINILDKLHVNVENKAISFIGLGSIGKATVLSLFKYIVHPNKIILCDIYGSEKRLSEIENILREEINFKGIIEKQISSMKVPDSIYESDIMICAVSSANILDIDKLKPNSIVIDDSFPHCFDVNKAIKRMKEKNDIYVIGGGLLDFGSLERYIHLPIENSLVKEYLTKNLIDGSLASCQAESLLMVKNQDLDITMGLVDHNQVHKYIKTINELNIKATKLHLGSYILVS